MKWGIALIVIGLGLITIASNLRSTNTPDAGHTNSEVRSIQHQAEIDSCVNVAETYIKAADMLDPLVDVSNSGLQARDLQIQYLDSAAKYKKAADLLILKP
jgi:hypothetical protein